MTTTIVAAPGRAIAFAKGVPLRFPPAARDTSLDISFDCHMLDSSGDPCWGVSYAEASGEFNGGIAGIQDVSIATAHALAYGTPSWGSVLVAGTATGTANASGSGTLVLLFPRKNWIQWAKPGTVNFTKDKQNKAGDTPLDWKGYVWDIRVLNDSPVAYGENGVSVLIKKVTKYGWTYGYKTLYEVGLKGKGAIVGDKTAQYFIDNKGQMWKLSDKLEFLDYSEFLSVMTGSKIVMSMDSNNGLIYICDGTYGYVYSTRTGSMASGPVNVTGIGIRDGTLFVVSPAAIVIPGFEKWTGIHDMKTRKSKTIEAVEVGVDLSIAMQASIEWRMDKATAFARLPWQYLGPGGVAYLFCHGVEFRFGLKTATYASFEIDHINVRGVINDN
jgi:hypothetical protein